MKTEIKIEYLSNGNLRSEYPLKGDYHHGVIKYYLANKTRSSLFKRNGQIEKINSNWIGPMILFNY